MPNLTLTLTQEHTLTVENIGVSVLKLQRLGNLPGGVRDSSTALFNNIEIQPNSFIKVGPFTSTKRYIIIGAAADYIHTINEERLAYNHQSTGIMSGGVLSVNGGDVTKFDVAAGSGTIVDNYTDPENPNVIHVNWPTYTAVTPTYIAAAIISFIGIDAGGNVEQFVGAISDTSRRDSIIIGILVHTNNSIIEGAAFFPYPAYDPAHAFLDFSDVIGPMNKDGNKFSANGSSLELTKTLGTLFRVGVNWVNSQKTPNNLTVPAETTPNFFVSYKDGSGSFIGNERSTTIDPTKYDDGTGTLATITGNKWQIMRVFLAPNFDVILSPGQNLYTSQTQALSALNVETFDRNPATSVTNFRAFIVIKKNCTDLSDTATCSFIEVDKFGQVAAEGVSIVIPSGISTVSSTPKTSAFNVNLNKAYIIDNSSNTVQGTLAEADDDNIGNVAECWITSNTATYNVTIRGQNDTDTINGVTGTGGSPAIATFSATTSGYQMFRVTVIDTNTYLIDGTASVAT